MLACNDFAKFSLPVSLKFKFLFRKPSGRSSPIIELAFRLTLGQPEPSATSGPLSSGSDRIGSDQTAGPAPELPNRSYQSPAARQASRSFDPNEQHSRD